MCPLVSVCRRERSDMSMLVVMRGCRWHVPMQVTVFKQTQQGFVHVSVVCVCACGVGLGGQHAFVFSLFCLHTG